MPEWILGLSFGFHDSAVAFLNDGEIAFAAQEERFSRIKHDSSFPSKALAAGLANCELSMQAIDHIYYYEDPDLKIERIEATYQAFGLRGYSSFLKDYPAWHREKRFVRQTIGRALHDQFSCGDNLPSVDYIEHHLSHAASAFYPSPFDRAAVLCIDGVGEWATTTGWVGNDRSLELVWEIRFPHSLGLLYSAITYYCGFKVDSGEYKVMGLAPYGRPAYVQLILDNLIDLKPDGSFWLNMDYFDYAVGDCMISDRFSELFDGPPRTPESLVTEKEFDLAASIQVVIEEAILRLGRSLRQQTGESRLCMAGGVALNCVANGKLKKDAIFDNLWIQPASGDCGGALGAALAGWHLQMNKPRQIITPDGMKGAYLGTSYGNAEIREALVDQNASFEYLDEQTLITRTAEMIAAGNVVGWFQGRMEFGPRALGGRSIIGDPRNRDMQSIMNLKIKFRESFRPFAPSVMEEHAEDWFELDDKSAYMLLVVNIRKERQVPPEIGDIQLSGIDLLKRARSEVPAITHVDMSARVQTVGRESNKRFYSMIERFHRISDCPIVINTSFNVRGEPIVESPLDAYRCFMSTDMDVLVIGNFFLKKSRQKRLDKNGNEWRTNFTLD